MRAPRSLLPAPCLALLRAYFYSGWAFLMPYLGVYLLYYLTKWPVNPINRGEISDFSNQTPNPWVPCMLHVYWALHAIHVILAGFALWSALRASQSEKQEVSSTEPLKLPTSNFNWSARFTALAPWALLALVFYIPGVYLEWPSDPWQHYARINEWSWYDMVSQHFFWEKSSYFLGYSLIGHITPPFIQLKWFDVYYTACSLLLCWQYFRLSRAIGLEESASFVFILLQVLLFGNFIFGFYRYYGMSSTIFAQIGAVAVTRIALGFTSQKFERQRNNKTETDSATNCRGAKIQQPPINPKHQSPKWLTLRSRFPVFRSSYFRYFAWLLVSGLCLMLLTAFSHQQGIGIAALGLLAVIIWRLITWKNSMTWYLGAITFALNLAVLLWWPRHPLLDAQYRPDGWLTPWYGFNLFMPRLIPLGAFDRTMAILGAFGIVNLGAGLLLLRRNHIVAWLTIVPPLALSMPLFAIPFSGIILNHNPVEGLITFTRLLLSIPAGLATVTLLNCKPRLVKKRDGQVKHHNWSSQLSPAYLLLMGTLLALTAVPAVSPYYNRLFNVFVHSSQDLSMKHVLNSEDLKSLAEFPPHIHTDAFGGTSVFKNAPTLLTTQGIAYVAQSTGKASSPWAARQTGPTPAKTNSMFWGIFGHIGSTGIRTLAFWPTAVLTSANSQAAQLSGHWGPNTVALEHSGQQELSQAEASTIAKSLPPQLWLELLNPIQKYHYVGDGAGTSLMTLSDDRGSMNSEPKFAPLSAGQPIVLRSILRTPDGKGRQISVTINGPHSFHKNFERERQLNSMGTDSWLYNDFAMEFPEAGLYTIELYGLTVWPAKTYRVQYKLTVLERR